VRTTVGILVGGQSQRMGGRPKGLLPAPGSATTIIERTIDECRKLSVPTDIVLLGRHEAYAQLPLVQLDDSLAGLGPIGGLSTLLDHANPAHPVLLLACDMPFLSSVLLERLLRGAPQASALAPHSGGHWLPTFSRYEPRAAKQAVQALLDHGETALRAVLDALGAERLPLTAEEATLLTDWDCPADMQRGGLGGG
jgi:molybdopterin-guanine dinucleotide biosynthesis protein A